MSTVKRGDTIRVHYKGTFSDGTAFDSSEGREPLEFVVGEGMVIHGFDNGVINMSPGEKKTLNIPFMEGYGPLNEEMKFEFDRAQLPEDLRDVEIGAVLNMVNQDGHELPVAVVDIKENTLLLDANHPLAGKDLVFEVELVEIV